MSTYEGMTAAIAMIDAACVALQDCENFENEVSVLIDLRNEINASRNLMLKEASGADDVYSVDDIIDRKMGAS